MKSVFEKLCFYYGLEWTVGLTVEIKLSFQISPAQCGQGLRKDITIRACNVVNGIIEDLFWS